MDEHQDLRDRLRSMGTQPPDMARQSADLTAMAAVVPRSRLAPKLRVAGAFLAGLLIGSTGLAAADVLPDPAQHVAHGVLARAGVSVPDPERYHGPECGDDAKRNHGAYLRDDKTLAESDCGKKVNGVRARGADGAEVPKAPKADNSPKADKAPRADKAPKADKGPCEGRPPWAGRSTLSPAEVEAAKAERISQCGPDDDENEGDLPE